MLLQHGGALLERLVEGLFQSGNPFLHIAASLSGCPGLQSQNKRGQNSDPHHEPPSVARKRPPEAAPQSCFTEKRRVSGMPRLRKLGKIRGFTGDYAQIWTMPCLMAKWMSSALFWMPRDCIISYLWNSTVRVEMPRTSPISFAGFPSSSS